MNKPELREGFNELIEKLRSICRDGVEKLGPDGKTTGERVTAPASYFATALKAYQSAGITASDEQASNLAADIAAATGVKFEPKLTGDVDEDAA